ncbi:MAG: aspartate aminotransferase family protein [Actinobacteria bacterium]|nr:aspartate aminotransferase family protein [Actinomycetota bacterium]
MAVTKSAELVIDRGEDVWVWDEEDRKYLDATAGLWYTNVGHGRTEIQDAVKTQMEKLEAYPTFNDLANRPALELADRLAALAPVDDARIFFGSGGGDAVDTAAKLAIAYWEKLGQSSKNVIISRQNSYHGTHGFGTSLAGIEPNRVGWGPLIEHTERVPHDSVEATAAAIDRIGADSVAAIFVEPVIGAGGVIPPRPGYLEGIAQLARDREVLLVLDSVIGAFGRLGTWFGVERWDVQPDMIVFAKGVTSGYLPLGGLVVSGRIAEPFWGVEGNVFRHGATYAGHPTCCAAALANLDLLEAGGLLARGRELEVPLLEALAPLAEYEDIVEVRGGTGLLAAVELSPRLLSSLPQGALSFAQRMRSADVLVRPLVSAIAISPPLTVTEEHLRLIAEAIAWTLREVDR